jgi:pyruvate formate lyase activating enzyme
MVSIEKQWQASTPPARLAETVEHRVVRCHLSPRNRTLKPGQHRFCGVRAIHR